LGEGSGSIVEVDDVGLEEPKLLGEAFECVWSRTAVDKHKGGRLGSRCGVCEERALIPRELASRLNERRNDRSGAEEIDTVDVLTSQ
jgi:hypothetical protein